jgi:hypothetical protein
MKRLLVLALLVWIPSARAGDEVGGKQTIAYVQKLQTSNGGFLSMAPKPNVRLAPTLRATSAGVRTLHYLGGEVPNKEGAVKFVVSCWDEKSGGFSDLPKGKPDVFTTAVGLMALKELKIPAEKYEAPAVVKFLADNAKTFDEIRIAVAGLEAIDAKSPKADAWIAEVRKLQNDDGTFGKGAGQARATGGSAVALLRLGAKLDGQNKIVAVLKDGQRLNGGYGKEDDEGGADLETTYRVMRCFHMLKERPKSVEGIRSFIAKCRSEDGGYGVAPGQDSTISGTYYAAIILHWLKK